MARFDLSDRYQGLFLPDITEYTVQRDDGSEYKTFTDRDEAQEYFVKLQQLDNQEKLVESQAQMANELKRQNDLAARHNGTSDSIPHYQAQKPITVKQELDPAYREWLQFKKETDPAFRMWKQQKEEEKAKIIAEQTIRNKDAEIARLQKQLSLQKQEQVRQEEQKLRDEEEKKYEIEAKDTGVDLGLSVRWATCNLGAISPEDNGKYFAWGEISPKTSFDYNNYKYFDSKNTRITKYCNQKKYALKRNVDNQTILDVNDDAASANIGGNWRMPTREEFEELIEKCDWIWTTRNKKNGFKIISRYTGHSIFLPAAGRYDVGTNRELLNEWGSYWSKSLFEGGSPDCAYELEIESDGPGIGYDDRSAGKTVRPVNE